MFSRSVTISRQILAKTCRNSLFKNSKTVGFVGLGEKRWNSDLPYHLVVGMPALSPTMEAGVIAEWKVAEGDSFIAGDSLAEIETDKATIDFEAQDDGVVAKILVESGAGDIPVNKPIMVTVEDEADVAAFADFVVEESAPEHVETPVPTPEPTVSEPPKPEPVVATSPAPVIPPPPPVVETPIAAPIEAPEQPPAPTMSPVWGTMAKKSSPIASLMTASQKKYVELYGSTGQVPL